MQVDAICSSSALEDKDRVYKPILDDYFDHEAERQDKEAYDAERKKAQAKQSYVKRVIVHPNFKNIDYKRAEKILDNLEKVYNHYYLNRFINLPKFCCIVYNLEAENS